MLRSKWTRYFNAYFPSWSGIKGKANSYSGLRGCSRCCAGTGRYSGAWSGISHSLDRCLWSISGESQDA